MHFRGQRQIGQAVNRGSGTGARAGFHSLEWFSWHTRIECAGGRAAIGERIRSGVATDDGPEARPRCVDKPHSRPQWVVAGMRCDTRFGPFPTLVLLASLRMMPDTFDWKRRGSVRGKT